MAENNMVSIIIVSWNTREMLHKCLSSIYATIQPVNFEVLVVDNASSDGSADMVAESFPSATLIGNSRNTGFAAGNNLGISKAAGSYIMLLNPDAELLPGSVQAMLNFAESHTDAAVIGPKLLNADESLQKNGRKFPTLMREILHITKIHRFAPGWFERTHEWGREDFDSPAKVDEVCGACMLVRRSAIDKAGVMDERFFMYYEEVDWCRRFKKAGFTVWYLPEATVVHHSSQSAGQLGIEKNRIAYNSQYLYFLKNSGPVQAGIMRILSFAVIAIMYAKRYTTCMFFPHGKEKV